MLSGTALVGIMAGSHKNINSEMWVRILVSLLKHGFLRAEFSEDRVEGRATVVKIDVGWRNIVELTDIDTTMTEY
jgi:hypothetical protein